MAMFKRGFDAVSEEKQRQDEQRSKSRGLFRFFLGNDGDEADISFLTEQPVNYYEHTIKTIQNGKERYLSIPCIGEGCTHCENGDRPSFKSAWLIIDHREFSYTDKDGKKQEGSDQLRLLVYGTKVASLLDRKSKRYGLIGKEYTVIRLGKGTSTNYTFENGDSVLYSTDEIKELMSEEMSVLYDGSVESLYSIIEQQISLLVEDSSPSKKSDTTLVSDDEEEEESPIRKKLREKNSTRKKLGRKENSVKKLLRNRG